MRSAEPPEDPRSLPLDDEHILEPIDRMPVADPAAEPVVRDVHGRLWRVRRNERKPIPIAGMVAAIVLIVFIAWVVSATV